MAKNALGREIPEFIEGYGKTKLFQGAFALKPEGYRAGGKIRCIDSTCTDKRVSDIKAAIAASFQSGNAGSNLMSPAPRMPRTSPL